MQSRSTVNVILFLVVIVLIFNLYIIKNSTKKSKDILSSTQTGEITHIDIQHNTRTITLRKVEGSWRMTNPINISANDFRVGSIIKVLKTRSHGQYPIHDLDLDKYGLANPATTIHLNNIEIGFGIINPVNNYRYIKINEKVYLIDDNYYPLLSSQIGTLISRKLLEADSNIIKIVLPENVLELNKDRIWTSKHSISSDSIVETVNGWKNEQAFGVHNYIDRKSLGNIEVYLENQAKPVKFKITDTDPWLVIARPDINIEYHFNSEFYNLLIKPEYKNKSSDKNRNDDQKDTLVVPVEKFIDALKN